MHAPHLLIARLGAFVFLSALAQAATVRVVQNGTQQQLTNAIQASVAGDTVLVKGGLYGGVTITNGIRLVADPEGSVIFQSLTISGVPTGETCVVSGIVLSSSIFEYLQILACDGSVRLTGIVELPSNSSSVGHVNTIVSGSSDVAFFRSTLLGNDEINFSSSIGGGAPVPDALACRAGSRVALYDCNLRGGQGHHSFFNGLSYVQASGGGAAARVDATSRLFAQSTTFQGGQGGAGGPAICGVTPCGFGGTAGQAGGSGVVSTSGADVTTAACTFTGGIGGAGGAGGGPCCPGGATFPAQPAGASGAATQGTVSALVAPTPRLTLPSVVRSNQTLAVTVQGTPGDEMYLATSLGTQWLPLYALGGVQMYRVPARREFLGIVPLSGTLSAQLPITAGPAVGQAQVRHLQVVSRDVNGTTRLGGAGTVCVLDPSL